MKKLFSFAILLAFAASASADDLATQFANPPDSARPQTWWHWVTGNVSREGITADLEAMHAIGLGGAQAFSANQGPPGPVIFMSPEWHSLMKHAISESARLGMQLSVEACEGWSESGGPWVPVEESMQMVVSTTTRFHGPQKLSAILPQPQTVKGYYQDIAVFAWPATDADDATFQMVESIPAPFPAQTRAEESAAAGRPATVDLKFPRPAMLGEISFDYTVPKATLATGNVEVEVSSDGVTFKKDAAPAMDMRHHPKGTFHALFSPGRYRAVRLTIVPGVGITITNVAAHGPLLAGFLAKSGLKSVAAGDSPAAAPWPAEAVIPRDRLINLTGKMDASGRLAWDVPAGDWDVMRVGHTSTGSMNHPATAAGLGLECDKLSVPAVEHFFNRGLLGQVIAEAGPLAGPTLHQVLMDSWEAGCENWTPLMVQEFRKRRGYDPTPWLAALSGRVIGSTEMTERFLWDYRRTLADLVAENHYGTVARLAHEHGMKLQAEAVGISMPTIADQLLCKAQTDVPMGEFWVDGHSDTREAATAAHIYGKAITSDESFTSKTSDAGWAKDPYSIKALGDHQFCQGLNRIVFHRYAAQPYLDRFPGVTMGPWGLNFERTQTWWYQAAAWIRYITRCQFLLQQGRFHADVCFFYGEGAPRDVEPAQYQKQMPAGYDYDVCNADVLLHRMSVKDHRIVLPDGMSYAVLILPPEGWLTPRVLEKVKELAAAGATVAGPRPVKSPSLEDYPNCDAEVAKLAAELWGDDPAAAEHTVGAGKIVNSIDPAVALKAAGAKPDFLSDGEGVESIHRAVGGTDLYFVSNQKEEARTIACSFPSTGRLPEIWDPENGTTRPAAIAFDKDGRTVVPVNFTPAGSTFVVFREARHGSPTLASVSSSDGTAPEPLDVTLKEGKFSLLAWKSATVTGTTAAGEAVRAEAKDVPPGLEISGSWTVAFPPKWGAPDKVALDRLISWTDSAEEGVRHFSGTAAYAKEVDLAPELFAPARHLYLDLGQVKNLAEVSVNGQKLGVLWKPPFRVEITKAVRPGKNELAIKITNLWPNRLIGDEALPPAQRFTWTTFTPYHANSPLLASGLLGPVQILAADDTPFVAK